MSWADDLRKLADKGSDDLGKLAKSVKIALFTEVVQNTRVDTGRLKGNWQIQNGTSPVFRTLKTFDKTPLDDISPSTQNKIIQGSLPDSVTYFTNNLPYAKKYEEIDAMVANAAVLVRKNVRDEVRRLR